MINSTVTIHRGVKLFYDEKRQILYVDEIPHNFYNKTIDYPIWLESIVSKPGLFRREVSVPHFHSLPNGDLIKMENVKFPFYAIPQVKKIELIHFSEKGEKYHWLSVESKLGYSFMFVSSKGIKYNEEYLEYNTEIPEYFNNVKIF